MDNYNASEPSSSAINVSEIFDNSKLNKLSLLVLVICFVFMLVDGYDYGIISNAAPLIMNEWDIDEALFGPVFSVAPFGWLLGAIICGFLSDKMGRKRTLAAGGILFAVSTLAIFFSHTIAELLVWRFVIGFGAGGVVPVSMVLTSEYSSAKSRAKFITIMFSGFVIGSTMGSFIAAGMMPAFGWRSIFLLGAFLPIPAILLVLFALPESARWLVVNMKTPKQRALLVKQMKMIRPDLEIDDKTSFLANIRKKNPERYSPQMLFKGKLAWVTPMIWIFYASSSLAVFFIGNWMPRLLTLKGYEAGQASAMVGASGIFGIAGTILIGLWLDRFGMRWGAVWPLITIGCTALIGGSTGAVMMTWICMNAFFMNGGHTVLTVIVPVIYPYSVRAQGTGLANAAGRAGSIIGPIIGGVLISAGVPMTTLFYFVALPFVLNTFFTWILGREYDFHFKHINEGRDAPANN